MKPPVQISTRGRIAAYGVSRKVGSEQRLRRSMNSTARNSPLSSASAAKARTFPPQGAGCFQCHGRTRRARTTPTGCGNIWRASGWTRPGWRESPPVDIRHLRLPGHVTPPARHPPWKAHGLGGVITSQTSSQPRALFPNMSLTKAMATTSSYQLLMP